MEKIIFKGPMGIRGGYLQDSDITNCTLDMNFQKITSVADPTNPYDAVNLQTMNTFIGTGFIQTTISLTGTGWTNVGASLTRGSYTLSIYGTSDGAPTATFIISKSTIASAVNGTRVTSSGGNVTEERLEIRWNASSDIQIRKDGAGWDGNYFVKIY